MTENKKQNEEKTIDELKNELEELSLLIVDETIDSLCKMFQNGERYNFSHKLQKAKHFKNGVIIKSFIEKVDENYSGLLEDDPYKDEMYNLAKEYIK